MLVAGVLVEKDVWNTVPSRKTIRVVLYKHLHACLSQPPPPPLCITTHPCRTRQSRWPTVHNGVWVKWPRRVKLIVSYPPRCPNTCSVASVVWGKRSDDREKRTKRKEASHIFVKGDVGLFPCVSMSCNRHARLCCGSVAFPFVMFVYDHFDVCFDILPQNDCYTFTSAIHHHQN